MQFVADTNVTVNYPTRHSKLAVPQYKIKKHVKVQSKTIGNHASEKGMQIISKLTISPAHIMTGYHSSPDSRRISIATPISSEG